MRLLTSGLVGIGLAVALLLATPLRLPGDDEPGPPLRGQAERKTATLVIRVAPDAQLRIGGTRTQQTGGVRRFQSPAVAVDRDYSYAILATWKEAGQDHQRERSVTFRGGQTVDVDLLPLGQADQPAPGSFALVKQAPVILEPGESKKITFRLRRNQFRQPIRLYYHTALMAPLILNAGETTLAADQDSVTVEISAKKGAATADCTRRFGRSR
jgi:uncharacterized protein (TIGR03000 family)